MNADLEPSQFDQRLLRTVVTIIVLGLGALAWGWHSAHTPALKARPPITPPVEALEPGTATANNLPMKGAHD